MNDTQIPTVGMPATYRIGSDRYSGTITAVRGTTQLDFTWRQGGRVQRFRLRKGHWRAEGQTAGTLRLGVAEDYRDPSF